MKISGNETAGNKIFTIHFPTRKPNETPLSRYPDSDSYVREALLVQLACWKSSPLTPSPVWLLVLFPSAPTNSSVRLWSNTPFREKSMSGWVINVIPPPMTSTMTHYKRINRQGEESTKSLNASHVTTYILDIYLTFFFFSTSLGQI